MNSFCFFMLLHTTETPNETFSCFCTLQKDQMKLFHASAHDRNAKWNFFMLLHTTETPNKTFSCFCTRQKHQMKLFHASAHDRNTKWNFFMLLHTAERLKRIFSCCCTLQKGQKEDFRAWRKSFPKGFGVSAFSESYFLNSLELVVAKIWNKNLSGFWIYNYQGASIGTVSTIFSTYFVLHKKNRFME